MAGSFQKNELRGGACGQRSDDVANAGGAGVRLHANGWPTTPRHTTLLFGESYNALNDV